MNYKQHGATGSHTRSYTRISLLMENLYYSDKLIETTKQLNLNA